MKTTALATLLLSLFLQETPGETPAPKTGGWLKRHEGFVEEAKKGGFEVLFMGDSITDAWRNNPAKGLTGILLTQRAMTSPEPPAVFDDFWRHAYAAIAD